MQSGFDINQLVQDAQNRWLKPAEVLFILQNHGNLQITEEAPQKPSSGSLFLFNKRVLRFFRKDGHNWRKKKDGRSVGEAHERLKVGNAEALNCYYAHGEDNPNFQRRSYWMLDAAYEHIVFVHYREITEGKIISGSVADLSPAPSTTYSQSTSAYTFQKPGSTNPSDFHVPYRNHPSPGSIEVSSDATRGKPTESLYELSLSAALRRLKAQLSMEDENLKDYAPPDALVGSEDEHRVSDNHSHNRYLGMTSYSDGPSPQRSSGGSKANKNLSFGMEHRMYNGESVLWKSAFELSNDSKNIQPQREKGYSLNTDGKLLPSTGMPPGQERYQAKCFGEYIADKWTEAATALSGLQSQMYSTTTELPTILPDPSLVMPLELGSSLTVAKDQSFTIREISPEWGFANDSTKVVIIGSFLCNSSSCVWHCMFGDVEVPLQIIQDGVLCCQAPPQPSGKVTLCVTSGNRESCSEIREFEYREKHNSCAQCDKSKGETSRSTEEMLLLVRLVQLLLSDLPVAKGDNQDLGADRLKKGVNEDDSWDQIIEALLVGAETLSVTLDWLLQQLVKDKLLKWLSIRSVHGLSTKEQGLIHIIAGLGYDWALRPVLECGVGVNFRDINGWTALHWAAKFGREKMVAALIASGASSVAVTDPSSYNPTGRNAAYIAAANGYKGLAGYLSEVALTSHLSSLTIEESELSKGSADLEAEFTVNNISRDNYTSTEDQLSLKHTLAAVRNAARAAARIQSAFRAHSFRKRQQKEAASSAASTVVDEYGFTLSDIQNVAAASKLAFHNLVDHDKAALSIQKKYRGWKGRKDFLSLRQKVVKIQAHVRGYQVRKMYKVICWAVGIMEKAVLRWRRKGAGLRGFRPETGTIDDGEDEDIVKVFRKEKVNVAINEAVSRVLSMVEFPEAQKQYHRMLRKVQEAKAERRCPKSPHPPDSGDGILDIDNDDFLTFP